MVEINEDFKEIKKKFCNESSYPKKGYHIKIFLQNLRQAFAFMNCSSVLRPKLSKKYPHQSSEAQRLIYLFFFVTVLFICCPVMASDRIGRQPKPPANSTDAVLRAKGRASFSSKTLVINKDNLIDGTRKLKSLKEKPMIKTVLSVRYGLLEKLELKLAIPYVSYDLKESGNTTIQNSGLGDVALYARYQILSQKRGDKIFVMTGIGLNMPTGRTDGQTFGLVDPPGMQCGSGAWAPIIDAAVTKIFGSWRIGGFVSYTISTLGENDYRFGNKLSADLSAVLGVSDFLDLELEVNSRFWAQNEKSGNLLSNTGGRQIYLTPGFHIKFGKTGRLDFVIPITVYRDLNGPQLSEDYRIVCKLAYSF